MLGPGLFVLPGLAFTIGGPAVILAYTVAGLLVIPAAMSMAEMSTALPESGGPYLFLDRSMGPLAGTLSGLGTWVSLILKSAFSLVGLGAYLLFFAGLPGQWTVPVALAIALFLIGLNATGGKKAGQVQTVLVIVTMFVLVDFVGWGSIEVKRQFYHPFFSRGWIGFSAATAFVFVSYAGIAKVVSVAEEIQNPSRNIPWGISLSLVVTILLYTLVVYVVVGVVPGGDLGHGTSRLMPLVQAGEQIGGYWGMEIMAGIAVLALASMANAGLMAASRFPLPLAREGILPSVLARISPRFTTPLVSILLTGTVLVVSITFLPVKNLAKLASAFLLLVFGLVNLAVIVFRESEIEWYQPDFRSPLYPYLHLGGFVICVSLIVFMGWFPLAGAAFLIFGCLAWYYLYARPRVNREGAIFRTDVDEGELELFRRARSGSTETRESVIVPFFGLRDRDMLSVERRIRLAAALCARGERLDVVDFVEVPEQSFLSGFDPEPEAFQALEKRVELLRKEVPNEIHVDQVVTHHSRGALKSYAAEEKPHWVVFDWQEPSGWSILVGTWKWWLEDFPCDTLFFLDRDKPDFQDVIVLTEPGPYDGEVVYAADRIARYFDGEVTFINPQIRYSRKALESVDSYQAELQGMCEAPSQALSVPPDEWTESVLERAGEADLLVVGGLSEGTDQGFDSRARARRIIQEVSCSVARVRSNLQSPQSVLKKQESLEDEWVDRLVAQDDFVLELNVEDKESLFERIAEDLAAGSRDPDTLEQALWDRENIQNTYVEHGVAFPHGIVDALDRTLVRVYVTNGPIPYTEAGDGARLFAVTMGPPSDRRTHLGIIGHLSRRFVQHEIPNRLEESARPVDVVRTILREGSP